MIVVGAGVIGVEYASIFSTIDVKVTLIDSRPDMLNFMDREIIDELVHHLRDRGVRAAPAGKGGRRAQGTDGRWSPAWKAASGCAPTSIMFAAGRVGCTDTEPGLEAAGIEPDERGRIDVNATSRRRRRTSTRPAT